MQIRTFLEFAVDACREAGKITLEYFQSDLVVETKTDMSPVSIADRKTEEYIRKLIEQYYPDHGIIGEEFGISQSNQQHKWYIDPIDGTAAFVRGVPIYGVMLALEISGELIAGVINFPALNEIVFAARGEGCFWNDRPARVSKTERLQESLLCHSGREYFAKVNRLDAYEELQANTASQRTWGDCYGHMLVATGRADLCVDPVLREWDAAPMIPILQEAGGTFTDWKGNITAFGREGISTNGLLQDQTLAITRRY